MRLRLWLALPCTALLLLGVALATNAAGSRTLLENALYCATNSTCRPLKSKVGDVVSVKDFGAVGDGTTDDTTAVQAAIISFGTAPACGTVYIPRGTYKITTMLDVNNREGCRLVEAGHGQAP